LRAAQYEALTQTAQAVSQWVKERGVRVISIETLLLPNLGEGEFASHATGIRTSGDVSSYWHQVVRVWYELEE